MMRMLALYFLFVANLVFWIWLGWVVLSADRSGSLSMGGGVLIFIGVFFQALFFGFQSALAMHVWHKRVIYGLLLGVPIFFLGISLASA